MIDISAYSRIGQGIAQGACCPNINSKYLSLLPKPPARILDLGAADGFWTLELEQRGYDVIGLEITKANPIRKIYQGDIHDIPFHTNSFDAVWASQILEHSPAPFVVFCELNRVLKLGGTVVATVPDSKCTHWVMSREHFSCLNRVQWESLVDKAAFKITQWIEDKENEIDINNTQSQFIFVMEKIADLPYINSMKPELLDKFEREYQKTRFFEQKYNIMAADLLEIYNPKSVLDYGCGMGFMIHALKELNTSLRISGYEISEYAAKNAYGKSFGLISNEPPKSTAELVLCMDVLEHIQEDEVQSFISNLVSLSEKYIFCSVCFDGDPNFERDRTHVTCKSRTWWIEQFLKTGKVEQMEVPDSFTILKNQMLAFKVKA